MTPDDDQPNGPLTVAGVLLVCALSAVAIYLFLLHGIGEVARP